MYQVRNSNRLISLAVSTALAGTLLTGCATGTAPRAEVSAADAQEAMAEGRHERAIQHAEAAVLSSPRDAAYRSMLGNAYLEAGRFASAQVSFDDAMALGDNSPRTALSLALALTAQAKYSEAAALLNDWEGEIAPADLGLALALAGQPERGIHIMTNAIRGGENTVQMRQNLAYAYAVAGRWREARVMVAQDVSADQVGDRMESWAAMINPTAYQHRVASLLGVPAGVRDAGQPVQLALANNPGIEQLAAEASALAAAEQSASVETVPVQASTAELPAVDEPVIALDTYDTPEPVRPTEFAEAFSSEAPAGGSLAQVAQNALRFVSEPVVQAIPVRYAATPEPRVSGQQRPVARRAVASSASSAGASSQGGTHLVQLGSFNSEQGARRAWGVYVSRNPELSDHEMVITRAVVRGRTYFRVSAGGFSQAESRSMCRSVTANGGEGCISWAANSPLPGAVDTGVTLASR